MELFRLFGTIAVSNSDANNAIDETTDKAETAHGKLGNVLGKVGNIALGVAKATVAAVATISTAFVAMGAHAVTYNAQMEQYNTSFAVMLGSQEKAVALVEDLKEKAAKTPFEMSDLAETTQLLLNYGLSAEDATEKMMMLGDIAQGDAQKMGRVANAYGQMSSAGKVSLEDIKQMIEAGFNPLQEISESTGESMESLYDRISKGTISVDEITASMTRATSEGGKYFQSMEKQSQTFSGRLSTLKDTIDSKLGEAFAGVSDTISNKVLPLFTTLAETYIPKLGVVLDQIVPSVMSMAETALPMLVSGSEKILPLFTQIMTEILPLGVSTMSTLLPIAISLASSVFPIAFEIIQKLVPPMLEIVTKVLPPLLALLMPILDLLSPILALLMPILDLVIALLDPCIALLNVAIPFVVSLADMLLSVLLPVIQQLCTFLETYVIPLIQFLLDYIIVPCLNSAMEMITYVVGMIMNIIQGSLDVIIGIVEFFVALFTGDWQGMSDAVVKIASGLGQIVLGLIKSACFSLVSVLTSFGVDTEALLGKLWTWVKSGFEKAKDFIIGWLTLTFTNLKTSITLIVNFMKTGFENAKNLATNIFTTIYTTIKDRIDKAVNFVKTGIEKLKGFFNFEWSLPQLKMPHFKIEGEFSLNPPSVPSLGVDWYAKGAVLNNPTAFGMNGNKLMVGGEAGPEAIAPISTLQKYVSDSVASQNADMIEVLYKILAAILSMDGNMGENMREALAGTSLDIDRREFARLVKAVN